MRNGYKKVINPNWREALDIEFTRTIVKAMLHPDQYQQ